MKMMAEKDEERNQSEKYGVQPAVREEEQDLVEEKRREGRENRVSEDHSNINVPGRKPERRHSLIKKLEKLIHISLGARGVVLLLV